MLDGLAVVDCLCVHPYGQRPAFSFPEPSWGFGVAATLIAHYHRFGKPIWVTEFGGREGEFDDGQARAAYYVEMIGAARRARCAAVLPFCWHDYDGFGIAGTVVGEAVSAAISRPELAALPSKGGQMNLEEVAAKHGGFYSPPVITSGTKRKPTSRMAYVNDTPNGMIYEINGEAVDGVFVPNA